MMMNEDEMNAEAKEIPGIDEDERKEDRRRKTSTE